MKYKPHWKPPGNPVFARNLLTFEKNEDMCKTGTRNIYGKIISFCGVKWLQNY